MKKQLKITGPQTIDCTELEKGDVFTTSEIERVTEVSRDDRKFPLHILALQAQIERGLEELGRSFTLRVDKGEIRICEDAEASQYCSRRQKSMVRGLERYHRKLQYVDTNELSETDKKVHERRLFVSSKFVAGIQQAKKNILSAPHERKTPLLGKVENE